MTQIITLIWTATYSWVLTQHANVLIYYETLSVYSIILHIVAQFPTPLKLFVLLMAPL
jgi:hypothetical protein